MIGYSLPSIQLHFFLIEALKPWLSWQRPSHIKRRLEKFNYQDHREIKDTRIWWYFWLDKVVRELKLDIDIEKFNAARPTLGLKVPKTYMYDYMAAELGISYNASAKTNSFRNGSKGNHIVGSVGLP